MNKPIRTRRTNVRPPRRGWGASPLDEQPGTAGEGFRCPRRLGLFDQGVPRVGKKKRAKTRVEDIRDTVSRAEIDRAAAFMGRVVCLLGLPTWRILIAVEPADEDCAASIQATRGRYCATVRLNAQWETFDLETRRLVLVHETLHLLHHRIDDALDGVRGAGRYRLEAEYMVDLLSHAVTDWPAVRAAFDDVYAGVASPD